MQRIRDLGERLDSHRKRQQEQQINDLVNQAYGLTPEEIDLMWKTAPHADSIPSARCFAQIKRKHQIKCSTR